MNKEASPEKEADERDEGKQAATHRFQKQRTLLVVSVLFLVGFVFLVLSLNNQTPLTAATGNVVSLQEIKNEPMYFYFTDDEEYMAVDILKLSYDTTAKEYTLYSTNTDTSLSLKGITVKKPKYCEIVTPEDYINNKAIFQCSNAPCDQKKEQCIKIELLQEQDVDVESNTFTDVKFKLSGVVYVTSIGISSADVEKYKNDPNYVVESGFGTQYIARKLEKKEAINKNKKDLVDYLIAEYTSNSALCPFLLEGKIGNNVNLQLTSKSFTPSSSITKNYDVMCRGVLLYQHLDACGVTITGEGEGGSVPHTADKYYTVKALTSNLFDSYTDFVCLPTYIKTGANQYTGFASYIECDAKNNGGVYPDNANGVKVGAGILAETKKDIFQWNNYNGGKLPKELLFSSPGKTLTPQQYAQHLLCAPYAEKYESWYICDPNNNFPKQQHGVTQKLFDKVSVGKDYYVCTVDGWAKGEGEINAPCKGKKNGFIMVGADQKTTTVCFNAGKHEVCDQKKLNSVVPITYGVMVLCTPYVDLNHWSECDASNDGLITTGYKTVSYKKIQLDKQNICTNYNGKDTWLSCFNGMIISPNADFVGTSWDGYDCTKDGWSKSAAQQPSSTNGCIAQPDFKIIEDKTKSSWILCYTQKQVICNANSLNKEKKVDLTTKYVCKQNGWVKVVETPAASAETPTVRT